MSVQIIIISIYIYIYIYYLIKRAIDFSKNYIQNNNFIYIL